MNFSTLSSKLWGRGADSCAASLCSIYLSSLMRERRGMDLGAGRWEESGKTWGRRNCDQNILYLKSLFLRFFF